MITIEISSPDTDATYTISPLDGMSVPLPSINDNLQHQELICQCKIAYQAEYFEFIMAHERINAVVYDGDTPVFTGVLNTDMDWIDNGYPLPLDNISLSICDNTTLFEHKTAEEVVKINQSLKTVADYICAECGAMADNSEILANITVPAFVLNANKQWLEAFNNLLFQYGFAFYFGGDGHVIYLNVSSESAPTVTLSELDMLTGVSFNRTSKKYTGVSVTYNKLIKKADEQVYWEGNGLDDNNEIIPITILPAQYWPYDSDPTQEAREGQVYQSFEDGYAESYTLYNGEQKYRRTSKTSLVYTENHRLLEDWKPKTLTIDRTEFGARRASVRLYNSTTVSVSLYQLAIRADAYYRSDDIVINYGKNEKPYEYQAEYIFEEAAASSFAEFLSRFFSGGNYRITCKTPYGINVGVHCSVDTGLSGFVGNAIVISCTYDTKTQLYESTLLTYGQTAVRGSRYKSYSSIYSKYSEQQVLGKAISSITEEYYLSTSATQLIGGDWVTTAPAWVQGKYIWTRTKVLYNSGDVYYTDPLRVTALENIGISAVDVEYAQSDNAGIPPVTGWNTNPPAYTEGMYIWSRTVTTFSDGSQSTSNPAVITGPKGESGDSVQYLGCLNQLPVTAVGNGQFFLSGSNFTGIYALSLIGGSKLKLLDGSYLSFSKTYVRGVVYVFRNGYWSPVEDRNDYRYILATNDLKNLNLPLSTNLQLTLDEVEDSANQYSEQMASNAESNAKDYTDEKAEEFQTIAGNLDDRITEVTSTVADIAEDNKLTPNEKITLLQEWSNFTSEYDVLTAEAQSKSVSATDYINAYKALATYLNGGVTWTFGTPAWLNNLTTTEDINGATLRAIVTAYTDAADALVYAINSKNAGNALQEAQDYADNKASEAESKANSYTDGEINAISSDIQKGVDAYNDISGIKDGTTQIYQPHYLGKLSFVPDTAKDGDWYVNTQTKTLQWKRNGAWETVTTYDTTNAHLYNQAGFDLLDYADDTGAFGQWAAAFIGKLFTRDIVLKRTVGKMESEGFDEDVFFAQYMTGMFRMRLGMGNQTTYDYSNLQIDQVNTKYVSANDLNIVSRGGYNNASLEIKGARSDTTNKYSYLLNMYSSGLEGYRDSQGNSTDVLWEMYTHTDNSLRLRAKYGFWVKKKDKNFFAETCGLGIASYSISESSMSGWIIFVNGVYVEWGEDISSSSISAINLSNAYNQVSYKVYLTAVGNVSTLPTVLDDNSHLKSMQSFYIKKPAGYTVFWLTIGTTNI